MLNISESGRLNNLKRITSSPQNHNVSVTKWASIEFALFDCVLLRQSLIDFTQKVLLIDLSKTFVGGGSSCST